MLSGTHRPPAEVIPAPPESGVAQLRGFEAFIGGLSPDLRHRMGGGALRQLQDWHAFAWGQCAAWHDESKNNRIVQPPPISDESRSANTQRKLRLEYLDTRARRNAVPADLKKRWQEIDQKKYSHLKVQTAAREIEKEAGGGFVFGTIADHLRAG